MATRIRLVLFVLFVLLVSAGAAQASSAARTDAASVAAASKAPKIKKAPKVKKARKVKKVPTVTLTGQVSAERTAKGRLLSVSLATDEGDILVKLDGRARKLAEKQDGAIAECTGKMITKGKGDKAREWFVLKAWKPIETSDEDDAYDDEEE